MCAAQVWSLRAHLSDGKRSQGRERNTSTTDTAWLVRHRRLVRVAHSSARSYTAVERAAQAVCARCVSTLQVQSRNTIEPATSRYAGTGRLRTCVDKRKFGGIAQTKRVEQQVFSALHIHAYRADADNNVLRVQQS